MPSELVITNGDHAAEALRAAGIGTGTTDRILPWSDVLFEGPVPGHLTLAELSEERADHLAARGWGAGRDLHAEFRQRDAVLAGHAGFDFVTLWFEHDLSDMLQLLQLLDYFATAARDRTTVRLVHTDRYLSRYSAEDLQAFAAAAKPAGTARFNQAVEAWARWREPDPRLWLALAHRPRLEIKHLWRAVLVSDGVLPATDTGLSLPEKFIITEIQTTPKAPAHLFAAFSAWHDGHCGMYMGDWSFWSILDGLAAATVPLLTRALRYRFSPIMSGPALERYLQEPVALSEFGREVLAGRVDHAKTNRINRWMGGTHITNDSLWRYDSLNHRVIAPSQGH